ncbi:hypothetical protein B0H19DRAFT_693539 [Mycena capillaripes]|nr:hypothetical protein B0H19DRAFT_693539 [Mycena capillaripes]
MQALWVHRTKRQSTESSLSSRATTSATTSSSTSSCPSCSRPLRRAWCSVPRWAITGGQYALMITILKMARTMINGWPTVKARRLSSCTVLSSPNATRTKSSCFPSTYGFICTPGSADTNLEASMTTEDFQKFSDYYNLDGTPKGDWKRSVEQCTATYFVAGFDPSIADKSGAYLVDCNLAPEQVAPHATDKETAKRLWELSEKLVSQKFDI